MGALRWRGFWAARVEVILLSWPLFQAGSRAGGSPSETSSGPTSRTRAEGCSAWPTRGPTLTSLNCELMGAGGGLRGLSALPSRSCPPVSVEPGGRPALRRCLPGLLRRSLAAASPRQSSGRRSVQDTELLSYVSDAFPDVTVHGKGGGVCLGLRWSPSLVQGPSCAVVRVWEAVGAQGVSLSSPGASGSCPSMGGQGFAAAGW